MLAVKTLQDLAGQPVELHQYLVWPLDLREEVSEYCNSPGVSGMGLVLGTKGGGPDPVETFCVCLRRRSLTVVWFLWNTCSIPRYRYMFSHPLLW